MMGYNYNGKGFRLALSIVSGRKNAESLDQDDLVLLGYDTYKFGYYGAPDRDEILIKCEDIMIETVEILFERTVDLAA